MTLPLDDLRIEYRSVTGLKPYARNARTHSKKQVKQIARSIERFGFVNPILVDEEGAIIAGHGRCAAAKLLGMEAVPTVRLSHLSADERRAYILADNQLAAKAGWDRDLLATELRGHLRYLRVDRIRRVLRVLASSDRGNGGGRRRRHPGHDLGYYDPRGIRGRPRLRRPDHGGGVPCGVRTVEARGLAPRQGHHFCTSLVCEGHLL